MLSNRFPALTPSETDQYLRHAGQYIVSHYRPDLGQYVASRHCSIAYAIDVAGHDDTDGLREYVRAELRKDGCAVIHDLAGRKVSIIDPATYN